MGGVEETFMAFMEEFNKQANDKHRWELLLNNKQMGWVLILDNDETYVTSSHIEGCEWFKFSKSIGNSPGLCALLETIGVKQEFC